MQPDDYMALFAFQLAPILAVRLLPAAVQAARQSVLATWETLVHRAQL